MHEAFAVGVVEPGRHLAADAKRIFDRKLALPKEAGAEALTRDERHHVIEEAGGFAGVVERQDVGVAEPGSDPDFLEEAGRSQREGEIRAQDFQRDLAAVLEVGGEIHRRHPAPPHFPLDGIPLRQHAAKLLQPIHGYTSPLDRMANITTPVARGAESVPAGIFPAWLTTSCPRSRRISEPGTCSAARSPEAAWRESIAPTISSAAARSPSRCCAPSSPPAIGSDRFLREIRILARLRHPHILPLLDSSVGGGSLYYVSPYIAGSSLQHRLARDGPLDLAEALGIAGDIAAAIDHAHREDVIHRDVKPGNVLLDAGRAIVCDFGIARAVELAAGDQLSTTSGFALGTPAYMSPEQASGGPIDFRSDVYGLGCVIYEMLAGEPPFSGPTAQAVLARSLAGEYRSLCTVRPELSAAADAAIRAALASEPEGRPRTAMELVSRLR